MSSHLLLVAHVGKFVIVSAAAYHDLDKALRDKKHILQLVVAPCIKGIHDGFDRLIDVVWRLLVLK